MIGGEASVENGRLPEEGDDMPLHYSKGGYSFCTDAGSLVIEPGPRPTTLSRGELMELGIEVRDDYRVPRTGRDLGPSGISVGLPGGDGGGGSVMSDPDFASRSMESADKSFSLREMA